MNNSLTNKNGITFEEFLQACFSKTKHKKLFNAWKNNENPTDFIIEAEELYQEEVTSIKNLNSFHP